MSNTDNSKARRGRPPKLPLGARYHIYVDAQTAAQIQTFLAANASGHTSISISDLFVRAVRRYLKQEDTYWSLEFKMQEVLAKKFENLNTHVMVLSEIVLRFLDYWFALWPDRSPEEDQDSIDKSYRMMALFNSSLREILAAGGRLWELTPEHLKDIVVETSKELDFRELANIYQQAEQDRKESASRESRSKRDPGKPN